MSEKSPKDTAKDLKKKAEEIADKVEDTVEDAIDDAKDAIAAVSYTHLTLPTNSVWCRSRWSPYH